MKRYKYAIEAYKKAIEFSSHYAIAYNNQGNSLIKLKRYDEAIKAYKEAIKLSPKNANFYNNLGSVYEVKSKKNENKIEIDKEFLLSIISIINLIKYKVKLTIPKSLELNEQEKGTLEEVINYDNFQKVIDLNNNDLLTAIIRIIIEIHNFKIGLLIDESSSNSTYYQYTSLDTLKSLLNLSNTKDNNETNINLRLYDTDYMNDPDEGSTLLSYLGIKNETSNKASHCFIASLTPEKQKDEIPMWRMYGDNNKGVSIGFKGFPILQEQKKINISSTNNSSNNFFERMPQLYKVLYVDFSQKENSSYLKKVGLNQVKDLIDNVNSLFDKFKTNENFYLKENFQTFITNELGYVRFLVKNQRYEYEQETRLLQITESFKEAKYDINNNKLFMEYRKSDDLNKQNKSLEIKEIIFGIDSDLPNDWSAMVEKKLGDNIKLTRTDIHYRS